MTNDSSTPSTSTEPYQTRKKRNYRRPKNDNTYETAGAAIKALDRKHGKRSNLWAYQDAKGEHIAMTAQWDKDDGTKVIRQVARKGKLWAIGEIPEPSPLYGLPELADVDCVFITAGEKAADAARSIGLTASTSAHGSQSPNKTDWSPLAGKECVILPDHDEPGRKYADVVAEILSHLTPSPTVRVVELQELPDGSPMPQGGNVVDWIDAHGDAATPEVMADKLMALVDAAEVMEVAQKEPTEPTLRWTPFPVDALPEPLASFVKSAARCVQVDPSMVALPALCAAAAAIGASRSIEIWKGWTEPCILWGALVAPSGEGKTPAADKVLAAARKRDAQAQETNSNQLAEWEETHRDYEVDRKAWERKRIGKQATEDIGPPPTEKPKPPMPRFTVGDVTVERLKEILADSPRGLLMIRDELTGLLGGFDKYSGGRGGSDRSTYLSFNNAQPDQNDRKTDNRQSLTLKNPHLSIFGGIQPELLNSVMSREDVASGLPGRFLYAMPPATPKSWKPPAIPTKSIDAVAAMFRSLYSIGAAIEWSADPLEEETDNIQHSTLIWTTEADQIAGEFYVDHYHQRHDLYGAAKAAWPKLMAYCARLALVIQLIRDPDSTEIDEDSIRRAIVLIRWFCNEALRIYSMRTESDEDREDRELVALIQGKGGSITARDLSRGPRQYRQSGAAEAALNRLVDIGLGKWQVISTSTNKKRVFFLDDSDDSDRFA